MDYPLIALPQEISEAKQPDVFLHSSFRTGSTWLWSAFRQNPRACTYYEIFNEQLHKLDLSSMSVSPTSWESHHPDTAPYFLEFMPVLKPGGGVDGFELSMSYREFFGSERSIGELSKNTLSYINRLSQAARVSGRTPVFSSTRSLARARHLKASLGGFHIVVKRNLLHQWFSYSNQDLLGNPYFLRTISTIVFANCSIPEVNILALFLNGKNIFNDTALDPRDELFCVFVALHIFLYAISLPYADLTIDVTNSGTHRPNDYRELQQQIESASGLRVDFSDARFRLSFPRYLIQDIQKTDITIRVLLDSICQVSEDAELINAVRAGLTQEIWTEYERYTSYAGGLHKSFQRLQPLEKRFEIATKEATDLALLLAHIVDETRHGTDLEKAASKSVQHNEGTNTSETDQIDEPSPALLRSRAMVSELRVNLAQLVSTNRADVAALQETVQSLSSQGRFVQLEKAQADAKNAALTTEISHLQRSASELQGALIKAEEKSAQLQTALSNSNASHELLEAADQALRAENATLTDAIASLTVEKRVCDDLVASLYKQLEQVKVSVEQRKHRALNFFSSKKPMEPL